MSVGPIALALLLVQAAPFAVAPVADEELADQRGGFRLPNGVDVALTVQTQTAVDGAVVLRTVFQVDQGSPMLAVYAPRAGETVTLPAHAVAATSGAEAATVMYDSRQGIRILSNTGPALAVSTNAAEGPGPIPVGLERVGDGAVTAAGRVVEAVRGGVQTVTLASQNLQITHFSGDAFGSAIANSGSDRTIDTQTFVAIDLQNASGLILGIGLLRADGMATEALQSRF